MLGLRFALEFTVQAVQALQGMQGEVCERET